MNLNKEMGYSEKILNYEDIQIKIISSKYDSRMYINKGNGEILTLHFYIPSREMSYSNIINYYNEIKTNRDESYLGEFTKKNALFLYFLFLKYSNENYLNVLLEDSENFKKEFLRRL